MTADDQSPAGRGGQGEHASPDSQAGQDEQAGQAAGHGGQAGQAAGHGGQDEQAEQAEQAGQDAGHGSQSGQAGQDRTPARTARPAAAQSIPLNYQAVRRRFERQIATSQQARRQRFVLMTVGALSVLTLLVSCSAWVVTTYISAGLGRLDAGTSGTPSSGPVNILVVGVDTRGGLSHRQQVSLHVGSAIGENTDTMMLVHIPANHESVQVVSLPRDSWVSIPGHGMNKINAAYGIGGPALMVSTVESATGLDINDYVEVNFVGFVKVIDALGGVNVCLPYAVDDGDSGLDLQAGMHHVDGVTALEFARDRHSFATSDLARIADQQQLLSSAFIEATASGVLANPVRLRQVLASVTAAVQVDQGFNLIELADELRGVKPADVSFTTVPIASEDYQTPSGESAVQWNQPAATALFHRLQTDTEAADLARHASGSSLSGNATQRTAAQDACR